MAKLTDEARRQIIRDVLVEMEKADSGFTRLTPVEWEVEEVLKLAEKIRTTWSEQPSEPEESSVDD